MVGSRVLWLYDTNWDTKLQYIRSDVFITQTCKYQIDGIGGFFSSWQNSKFVVRMYVGGIGSEGRRLGEEHDLELAWVWTPVCMFKKSSEGLYKHRAGRNRRARVWMRACRGRGALTIAGPVLFYSGRRLLAVEQIIVMWVVGVRIIVKRRTYVSRGRRGTNPSSSLGCFDKVRGTGPPAFSVLRRAFSSRRLV